MPKMFKSTVWCSDVLFLVFLLHLYGNVMSTASCLKAKCDEILHWPWEMFLKLQPQGWRAAWIPCGWGNCTDLPPYLSSVTPLNSLRHTRTLHSLPVAVSFLFILVWMIYILIRLGYWSHPVFQYLELSDPLCIYCPSCEIECINTQCTYLQLLYLSNGLFLSLVCSDLL